VKLTINGNAREFPSHAEPYSIDSVLTLLGVRKEIVAIAHGDIIVPRTRWAETLVSPGDRIEVVHFVGGG